MPHSSKEGKDQIVKWCNALKNIENILDVGAGVGTYRKLSKKRNFFLNANWTAIEAWTPYIEKYNLIGLYNKIINLDARIVNYDSLKFDLVFMGDVLEHMTKEDAVFLVNKLAQKTTYLIISIPIVNYPQGAIQNNPYEKHVKDDWSHEEVMNTFSNIIDFFKGKQIGCYLIEFK